MDSFLKFTGGIAIAVGIHLLVSAPASSGEVPSSRFALLSHVSTHGETSDMGMSKPAENRITLETKSSSVYEPPVEGGPQSSQGSGTR